MPTYEYACDACGHEFEREQRMSEDPIKECPQCGKPKARRQISQGNFILKGSGWYSDLYSSSKKPKPDASTKADSGSGNKADSGDKSSSDKSSSDKSSPGSSDKSDKSSDSKPAAKADSAKAA